MPEFSFTAYVIVNAKSLEDAVATMEDFEKQMKSATIVYPRGMVVDLKAPSES